MRGVLPSEVAQIPAQISDLEVQQPQGRHDAESEGRSLPLSFHCYAMKESCPPPSADPRPGWLSMRGVLPSEVAQIPAQIGNLEVHQPQGRHDAESEGRSLPLSFHCYAMKMFFYFGFWVVNLTLTWQLMYYLFQYLLLNEPDQDF